MGHDPQALLQAVNAALRPLTVRLVDIVNAECHNGGRQSPQDATNFTELRSQATGDHKAQAGSQWTSPALMPPW